MKVILMEKKPFNSAFLILPVPLFCATGFRKAEIAKMVRRAKETMQQHILMRNPFKLHLGMFSVNALSLAYP